VHGATVSLNTLNPLLFICLFSFKNKPELRVLDRHKLTFVVCATSVTLQQIQWQIYT